MRILLIICSLILSAITTYAQNKYVVGSPICPTPISYKTSQGNHITLYPGGDNVFRYALTKDGLPCVKKGDKYYYSDYEQSNQKSTSIEVGEAISERKQKQLINNFNAAHTAWQNLSNSLKAIHLAPSVKSTGEINILLILVEFSNKTHTTVKADIETLFSQPGTAERAGFKEFFTKASHGKLDVTVDVAGWYNCDEPYANFSESKGMYLTGNLVRKAVDAAEQDGIDFSKYDNNGDGKADAIIVMHAGLGADHRGEEQYIWPHSWNLSGTVDKAVTYDGVKVDHYVIACERRVYNGTNKMAGIGTFAHEFGHALGLPDMYDGTGKSNGLGHWAMMSAGSWLDNGYHPSNFCAWSRYDLGWDEATTINYDDIGSYTLTSMNEDANQLIRINSKSDDQYFLIENRRAEGNDVKQPSSGLAIYQISKKKLALQRQINDNRDYPAIRLLEADFNTNRGLYAAKDRGVAADLFNGLDNSIVLGAESTPSTQLFGGGSSGVELSQLIVNEDNSFTFNVDGSKPMLYWSSTTLDESPLNDGSINKSITVDLEGDEFKLLDSQLSDDALEISNLPEGLSMEVITLNNKSLELVINGHALLHEADDNTNISIQFSDAAFTNLESSTIGNSTTTLEIDFLDSEAGIRLFVEDFESVTPPALPDGWEAPMGNKGSATHWETVIGSNHTEDGSNGIQFYNKNTGNESFWLISSAIDLKDYEQVSLSMWQKYDLKGDAKNKVAVSTDKENWTTIYDGHPQYSDVWEEATAVIPKEFKGKTIYLGFCIYEEQAWGWFWDDISLVVDDFNAIHDVPADNDVSVYYDDVLQTLKINAMVEISGISIYNMAGQEVLKTEGTAVLPLQHLRKGMYVVHVRLEDGSKNIFKFIK